MRTLLTWPVLLYLRFLAQTALALHKPVIIGIAGSAGKSSTRNALYAILKDHVRVAVIAGNSETGVPLGILGMKAEDYSFRGWIKMLVRAPFGLAYGKKIDYLIVEMGIDDPYPPKNMSYLLTIVKPDYAISLNVSPTHTEQFDKTLKEKKAKHIAEDEKLTYILRRIAEEDTKIITESGCKVGVYNADDRYIKEQIDEFLILHRKTTLLSFGKSPRNDISYGGYKVTLEGTHFSFLMQSDAVHEKITLFLKGYVLPKEYQELIAASLLIGWQLGLSKQQMKASFERNFSLPKSRSTLLSGIKQSVIIDSSYNASPSAVLAFLELFKDLKKQLDRPTVLLFGDMRELGEEAAISHEDVAKHIPTAMDYVYLVGPLVKAHVLPLLKESKKIKEVKWFPNSQKAAEYLKIHLPKESLVLVKGSQNTIYLEESIIPLLADKRDAEQLCRQDRHWKRRKQSYFASAEAISDKR